MPLMWVPRHSDILGNCRADELARAGAQLPEFFSIELGTPLASVKLNIERKLFRDANLPQVCSIARLTWLLMDIRRTNQ